LDDEFTGYSCGLRRAVDVGYLCGYVRITKPHPLYGVDYNEAVPESLKSVAIKVMQGVLGKRSAIDAMINCR